MRQAGVTVHVGTVAVRPASTERTFRQVGLDMIADKAARGAWARGTCAQRRSALGKLGAWADQAVSVAANDYDGAQAIVSGQGYPKNMVSVIKRTCEYAIRKHYITSHSLSAVEADRSQIPASRREFIEATSAQVESIAAYVDKGWRAGFGLMILLMRWCGLRTGEMIAVEIDDFSDNFRVLTIRRQADHQCHVTPLKGKKAGEFRTVPVPDHVAVRIAAFCEGRTGRVFTRVKGRSPVNREEFNAFAKGGAVNAGLPDEWVPYQLRHQYASDLIRRGVAIDRVAKMLGHSSTTITYQTYSHLMTGELDDIRSVLDVA
jgi:integrase